MFYEEVQLQAKDKVVDIEELKKKIFNKTSLLLLSNTIHSLNNWQNMYIKFDRKKKKTIIQFKKIRKIKQSKII